MYVWQGGFSERGIKKSGVLVQLAVWLDDLQPEGSFTTSTLVHVLDYIETRVGSTSQCLFSASTGFSKEVQAFLYSRFPVIKSKPYTLKVWGGLEKSAVMLTSFTNRFTLAHIIQQCRALKPKSPEFFPHGHSLGCWRWTQETSICTLPQHTHSFFYASLQMQKNRSCGK